MHKPNTILRYWEVATAGSPHTYPLASFKAEIWAPKFRVICSRGPFSHGNVKNCGRTCSWDATCLGFGTARSKLSQNETQIFGFSRANSKYIAWWFYIVNSWQTLERPNQCFQLFFQTTLKKHEGNEQRITFPTRHKGSQEDRGSFSIQACQTKWFYCPVVCCSQL